VLEFTLDRLERPGALAERFALVVVMAPACLHGGCHNGSELHSNSPLLRTVAPWSPRCDALAPTGRSVREPGVADVIQVIACRRICEDHRALCDARARERAKRFLQKPESSWAPASRSRR
jgi:hypothetical protein